MCVSSCPGFLSRPAHPRLSPHLSKPLDQDERVALGTATSSCVTHSGFLLLRGDASKLQVAVDDKDVSALDAKAVGKMLRGPVGTSVRIKVQKREGTTPRAYDVTLRRAAPKVQLRLQTTPPNYASAP